MTEDRNLSRMTICVFTANVGDRYSQSITIEITGDNGKVKALINLMRPYGIKEIVRIGLCAIERGNKTI